MAQDTVRGPVITGHVTINGGEPLLGRLVVEQEMIRVLSDRAVKADPSWMFTDDAGHWHAFAVGEESKRWSLPTLKATSRQAPCDGSCGGVCQGEGYTVIDYTCRICDQKIEPRYVPDLAAQTVGEMIEGLKQWTLTVESFQPIRIQPREQVSIRMTAEAGTFFGFGYAGYRTMEYSSDQHHETITIDGSTPLGKQLPG